MRFAFVVGSECKEGSFRPQGSQVVPCSSTGSNVLESLAEVVDQESVEGGRDPRMLGNECQIGVS